MTAPEDRQHMLFLERILADKPPGICVEISVDNTGRTFSKGHKLNIGAFGSTSPGEVGPSPETLSVGALGGSAGPTEIKCSHHSVACPAAQIQQPDERRDRAVLDSLLKRAFDVVSSLFVLILFWPVIGVLMIAIRLSSSGPSLFAQDRVGKGGKVFTLYKLRTMYQGTPNGATHTVSQSCVTLIGEFMRRWKLDELPQLINVLRGEMSFVGPRPCLPTQHELIKARELRGVFDVRPGITGLAQVQGVDMRDPDVLAAIDGVYVKTRSLLGDLYLVLATVGVVGKQFDPVDGSHVLPRMRPASLPIQRK